MDRAVTRAELEQALRTMEQSIDAKLEHFVRTMKQVIDNSYYRAEPFTVPHHVYGEIKRMLETGITALQQLSDDERAAVEIIESIETHAND